MKINITEDSFCLMSSEPRQWSLISAQTGLHSEYKQVLQDLAHKYTDFLLLDRCTDHAYNFSERCGVSDGNTYSYPFILQVGIL